MEVATDPGGDGALSIDGPGEHGAAVDVLDEAGEFGGVAGAEFAGGDGGVEELLRFLAEGAELREGDSVEGGVGEIDLEIGEAVGHSFGSGGEGGAFDVELDEGFERRCVFGAGGGELLLDGAGGGAAEGEQKAALGAETLDKRGGNDAGFLGDVGEGELRGAAALHDARGGGEDFIVGGLAGARAHGGALGIITEWPFSFRLTLVNGRLLSSQTCRR